MSLQFTSGPFAGRGYTTNTFTPGRAQPRPTPSQGTPYGGQAFQGNLGGQYNALWGGGPSPGASAPDTGAMQPKPSSPPPPASSSQPPQGPRGNSPFPLPGPIRHFPAGWRADPQGGPQPPASAYQPRQGPYISTTYAYPGGGWGHSPQPPGQQGGYRPQPVEGGYRPQESQGGYRPQESQGGYRPATSMMRRGR